MSRIVEFEQVGGPEVLTVVERTVRPPEANEVQVEMKAAGLNRAELMFVAGQYLVQPTFPARVGLEGAGIVVSVGDRVHSVSVGDEVCIVPTFSPADYGVIGDRVNVPATAIQPKPQSLSFSEAAATFLPYLTAWGGLVQSGGLRQLANQVVLITAASSSVGIAAIQLANAHGATTIATTRTSAKLEKIKAQSPDHIIVTEEENLVERIEHITSGKGFDIAFDCIAGTFVEPLAEAAAYEAVLVEYGILSMEETPFPFLIAAEKALCMKSFHAIFDVTSQPERLKKALAHLLPRFESGLYRMVVDRTFSLEEIEKAYAHMSSNSQFGKIVVTIGK